MHPRRKFLNQGMAAGLGCIGLPPASQAALPAESWRMPDEAEPHRASWMCFGPREDIWGKRLLDAVRLNLGSIARTIAAYEPVHMLVCDEDQDLAYKLCGPKVQLHVREVDDLWMRDTGPVFVRNAQGLRAGVDFNFNGWGKKQAHAQDAQVARFVAQQSDVPRLSTRLVLEGGGIEVDGQGTAIITESCVLNANRNPGTSKAACEAELKRLLGIEKVVWLPGIAGRDITDGHTDFYARFSSPGVVVAGFDADPESYDHAVTQKHLQILRAATDARGRKLKVMVLPGPGDVRTTFKSDSFAAGYINFYVCNGAVIAPEFGDRRGDAKARSLLQELFPKRDIVQLNIDAVAAGGGGIHCTTQQEPAI